MDGMTYTSIADDSPGEWPETRAARCSAASIRRRFGYSEHNRVIAGHVECSVIFVNEN